MGVIAWSMAVSARAADDFRALPVVSLRSPPSRAVSFGIVATPLTVPLSVSVAVRSEAHHPPTPNPA